MEIQILLIFILSILTVVFVAIGIYFVLILKEFRETIRKANTMLDDFKSVTGALAHPLGIVGGIFKGYKALKNLKKEE
ncbi:hypothetical protein A2V49_04385 [candidate division WWE3 bacterium RBG_19FT_COMBO_34_6]|uniref:Uncharacterized protein n=1 Tax=candidate division WWE3 bacterium RBG_19FT_COMBO_34_6 TaxID=1802612 RepID=A0A1F4UMP2_UNCKA|nr:MAG: hypothetical protein A2V49_04385 [candidate division WWE3 bacterium RBG_19FT_COMBO_34_6]